MKKILEILLYAWQLPQNIAGLLTVAFLRPEESFDREGIKVSYASRMRGGITLGKYVIIRDRMKEYDKNVEKHEIGHSKQSRILGPLYLLVIGLPSLIWAWLWNEGWNCSYFSFYTERWADRLGGVVRDE